MYPYHNCIRQRINNGELVDAYFADNYTNIGKCLVLVFETTPIFRPIRPHAYSKYQDVIAKFHLSE